MLKRTGDPVVTAGNDGVYPRDLPIGWVTGVEEGGELFHRVTLAPAVDLGRLDQVFVLAGESPPPSLLTTEDGGAEQ